MSSLPSSLEERHRTSNASSLPAGEELLVVPDSLQNQLADFRAKVWTSKTLEALVFGALILVLAFLTVYVVDRFIDTPVSARWTILLGAIAAWTLVPYALHRWVWRNRRFEQLARLLRDRDPLGDRLLGVLELADNPSEQQRSKSLCAAAIAQVADDVRGRDLRSAAPPTKLKPLSWSLAVAALCAVSIAALFPLAASNAWSRFSSPWNEVPRFTFTQIETLEDELIVPHGEGTTLAIALSGDSHWTPEAASLLFADRPPIVAKLQTSERDEGVELQYEFELPALVSSSVAQVSLGDFYQDVNLQPKTRPELIAALATIALPEYLGRTERIEQDVRSGALIAVRGSSARIQATASRTLESANVNESECSVEADHFAFGPLDITGEEESTTTLTWRDQFALDGREPFQLKIKPIDDEPPTVLTQDFPRQAVILVSEQINFQALAADDFGIRKIGVEWRGLDDTLAEHCEGEKVVAAGGPLQTSMQVPATFTAASLGIEPQPIEVRLWTEDYKTDRGRVYSPPHTLFVLTAEQHAIWITNQLSKWHRSSLDVRDQELQLNATNKKLRDTPKSELGQTGMQDALRRQAAFEASNSRRLNALTKSGEDLLRQAARNPEIGVGHLDRWADMLQVLNDIGRNRMPTVSDLLSSASKSNQLAKNLQGSINGESTPKESMPKAGKNRGTPGGEPGKPQPKAEDFVNAKQVPTISDMESTMQPAGEGKPSGEDEDPVEKKGNGSKLSLPNTTITGPANKGKKKGDDQDTPEPPLEEALFEQEELLAEFEKISNELNAILANLEGSTLVKRLKAESRSQDQVAQKIGSEIDNLFGASKVAPQSRSMLVSLSGVEQESSQKVSYIMDDMQSYFERRRMNQFKLVLEEMQELDVLASLEDLGEALPKAHGMSIAQAEFWADTLDRWADDLVDPASSGQCPGSKSSDALPPSVILEVLKILEDEVNLREETRVAEQARSAVSLEDHQTEAHRLAESQRNLHDRTEDVVVTILALPKGDARFGTEIKLLSQVALVMNDATEILDENDTGSPAIAAETEAIELLLQCKRINPKGGGGGGSSPGGGGKGDTQDSALALLGSGLNQNERREDREIRQATGEKSRALPEEYRAGLDKYFELLERGE